MPTCNHVRCQAAQQRVARRVQLAQVQQTAFAVQQRCAAVPFKCGVHGTLQSQLPSCTRQGRRQAWLRLDDVPPPMLSRSLLCYIGCPHLLWGHPVTPAVRWQGLQTGCMRGTAGRQGAVWVRARRHGRSFFSSWIRHPCAARRHSPVHRPGRPGASLWPGSGPGWRRRVAPSAAAAGKPQQHLQPTMHERQANRSNFA